MEIHDLFFGDTPLVSWVHKAHPAHEPWVTLALARDALAAQQAHSAIEHLQAVAAMPGLESRQYLEAWHALRELGVRAPAEISKRVLGVVVEVSLPGGLDVLAAYSDGTARYMNWSGAGVVWEAPNARFQSDIETLLRAGATIAQRIGPWNEPRRGRPPEGHIRLSMLTPSGLHFGEGPMEALARDALAGPLVAAATVLMRGLTSLPKSNST
jgi:hypothetical protein